MNIDLNDLTFENIGSWPPVIRYGAIIGVFLLIVSMGGWMDTRKQLVELKKAEQKEVTLRREFRVKHHWTYDLEDHQGHLGIIKESLGEMLYQLPGKTEVPGLLEDISQSGLQSGLEFKLFKPLPEEQQEFYAELPIEIRVVGNYHQLAEFVSRVSAMDRIVTLHDFNLGSPNKAQQGKSGKAGSRTSVGTSGKLELEILAKTYRYTEEQGEQ